MTPAARTQAAIELLDEIIAAARGGGAAADTLISRYFKARHYAGARDRRAIRDLVFRAIRRAGERPASGRAALLGLAGEMPELLETFDGSPNGAAPPAAGEPVAAAGVAPAWLLDRFDPLVPPDERPALLERAPLDLRVNRLKGTRADALAELAEAAPSPWSPLGLRLPEGHRVEQAAAWRARARRNPGRGQPAHLPRLRGGAGHAGGRSVRRRRRQDARARRRDGRSRPDRRQRRRSRPARADDAAAAGAPASRSSRPACSIRSARRRCSPISPAGPISSSSTRPARGPGPGGAIPRRAGGSRPNGWAG